jgi:hypothetical protein
MKKANVLSFTLRAGYLNRRHLFQEAADRAAGRGRKVLPGHRQPEVIYRTETGERMMPVRALDIPYLRKNNNLGAKEHLDLIIRARGGDTQAQKELNGKAKAALAIMGPRFSGARLTEDEYVISSDTSKTYPAELISHKGTILLKLIQDGYPVPDFTFLTSKAYKLGREQLSMKLKSAIAALEQLTGQRLGAERDPLLIAMRCAMPLYIPGVMPTYLNVGVTEKTIPALKRRYGEKAAARIILSNLKDIYKELDPEGYAALEDKIRPDLDLSTNLQLIDRLMGMVRKRDSDLLVDPYYQALFLMVDAYQYYEKNIGLIRGYANGKEYYPTMIFQKMVCSALDDSSYAGVLSSHDPKYGEERGISVPGEEYLAMRS